MTLLLHGGDGSPFVRVVRILLSEKRLAFERNTEPAGTRDTDELAALNPTLRVPILEDGERILFETRIIAEYLLAAYSDTPDGAPPPPLALAMTRPSHHFEDSQAMATIQAVLDGSVVLFQTRQGGVNAEDVPYLRRTALRIQTSLDWLDARATPSGLLPGLFSVQDMAAVCALDFLASRDIADWRHGPSGNERANLAALYQALQARPSVAETLPQ